jgi:hypothetical protein
MKLILIDVIIVMQQKIVLNVIVIAIAIAIAIAMVVAAAVAAAAACGVHALIQIADAIVQAVQITVSIVEFNNNVRLIISLTLLFYILYLI